MADDEIEKSSLQKDIRGLLRKLSKGKTVNSECTKLWQYFNDLEDTDALNPFRKYSHINHPIEDLLPLCEQFIDDATPKFISKIEQKDCFKELLKFETIHKVKEY